ncbi:MAG: hypothetical protein ACRD6I_03195 [Candidatus Acidiferrales bacterium]
MASPSQTGNASLLFLATSHSPLPSDIQILHVEGVFLDEFAALFDVFTYQHRENAVAPNDFF